MGILNFSRREFIQTLSSFAVFPEIVFANHSVSEVKPLKLLFEQNKPVMYVFAGDSVTQGALHTRGMRCYPEVFAERVRWEMRRTTDLVVNSGINGTNTSYLLEAYEWCVAQFKPDLVSVMFGINDCQENTITPEVFEDNLELIINKIRKDRAIPVLQTPNAIDEEGMKNMKTNSRQKLPDYVEIIRKVAKDEEVILVDNMLYWESKGLDIYKKWLDDPLHPNDKGHLEIARLMFKAFSIFDPDAFTCSGK